MGEVIIPGKCFFLECHILSVIFFDFSDKLVLSCSEGGSYN